MINSGFQRAEAPKELLDYLSKRRKAVDDMNRHAKAVARLASDSKEYLEVVPEPLAYLK